MISKRQWTRCLAGAKGQTLRESVNGELRSQDATINGMGIKTLRLVRQDGTWRVTVNGSYTSGGYEGLSQVLDSLSRVPVSFLEGDHEQR
jgi:hypothetical protein